MLRLRQEVFQYRLARVTTIVFQACSIDHSDISPLLESTVCERPDRDYRTRRRLSSRSSISFTFSGLKCGKDSRPQNCVRPLNVPRSLTAIYSSWIQCSCQRRNRHRLTNGPRPGIRGPHERLMHRALRSRVSENIVCLQIGCGPRARAGIRLALVHIPSEMQA